MNLKKKPCVALIFGGRGYEHDVSVVGADYVFSLIDRREYDVMPILIDKNGAWLSEAGDFSARPSEIGTRELCEVYPVLCHGVGGILRPEGFLAIAAAIPVLHGDFGEDGIVQGALECARIAFVGCDATASAAARDKAIVKSVAKELGIKVAKWITPTSDDDEVILSAEEAIGYPMFIKPARLGSSIGASRAYGRDELLHSIKYARRFAKKIIIEEYVSIEKELECAYFSAKGKELFTNIGEIDCSDGFYDYEKKYASSGGVKVSDESRISDGTAVLVKRWSKMLVRELGIRDLSRIDYFLSKDGELYFNEINTFPGFTSGSLYPKLVARCGVSPSELIASLIRESILRGA